MHSSGKTYFASSLPRAILLATLFLSSLFVLFFAPAKVNAAFDRNNIISDSTFTNKNTMTEQQIQSFLEQKGSFLAYYIEERTDSRIGPNDDINPYHWRASRIIWQAANWYGINPQVILATLQKEQSLITMTSYPSSQHWRIDWAMGYGCPDTSACATYPGFARQVDMGTWQFSYNLYYANRKDPRVAPYLTGNTITIDGASVYLSNGATASLYRYTPHFHGNENFYNIFTTWFGSTSSYPIVGGMAGKYNALRGAPGAPLSAEYPVYSSSGGYIGQAQDFEKGRLYWNKDTGQVFWVYGNILGKYDSLGREKSFLGLPLSDEYSVTGGRASNFMGGRIYWGSSTYAHVVYGAILHKYLQAGGPAAWGLPTTDEINVSGVTGARQSIFQRARIYWSESTDAHIVYGAILNKYAQAGGPALYGLPTTDEISVSGVAGARQSVFQYATIYWSQSTGAHVVFGNILIKYLEVGGPAAFGLPTTDETNVSGVTGARQSIFQRATIYWSGETGAHIVYGGILHKYLEYGGPTSALGLPVSDEYTSGAGRRSDFVGGYIYWESALGSEVFLGSSAAVESDASEASLEASEASPATESDASEASLAASEASPATDVSPATAEASPAEAEESTPSPE